MTEGRHVTELPVPLYDPDAILQRMRDDEESDWPDKLLQAMEEAPEILTPAELRVLECASRGLQGAMIADVLGVGLETVRTQLQTARAKLGAKNTCHACCEALRLGLLE